MPARKAIPANIRKAILSEYNHRCAICGNARPQLHHIDENHENNDPLNILPLCPNCHLGDQHNPTSRINPSILRLFREYKDPTILSPQFRPLFDRLWHIFHLPKTATAASFEDIESRNDELVRFIAELEMGSFYSAEIKKLLERDGIAIWTVLNADDEARRTLEFENMRQRYIATLLNNRSDVLRLAVELLHFQGWPTKPRAQS
jgi:hypothetical protein